MSLRLRITVLTAALIAITSTIIGIATYTTVASVQLDQLDTRLNTTLGSPGIKPQNSNNPAATKITGDFANPVAIVGVNTPRGLKCCSPLLVGQGSRSPSKHPRRIARLPGPAVFHFHRSRNEPELSSRHSHVSTGWHPHSIYILGELPRFIELNCTADILHCFNCDIVRRSSRLVQRAPLISPC